MVVKTFPMEEQLSVFAGGITRHNFEIRGMGDLRSGFWFAIYQYAHLESRWYFVRCLFGLNTHLRDLALERCGQHFGGVDMYNRQLH